TRALASQSAVQLKRRCFVRHIPHCADSNRQRHSRTRLLLALSTCLFVMILVTIGFGRYFHSFVSMANSAQPGVTHHGGLSFHDLRSTATRPRLSLLPSVRSSAVSAVNYYAPPIPQSGVSKIVFASNREGSMQIYLINGDGSGVALWTTSGSHDD